jgi:hypothetical protein
MDAPTLFDEIDPLSTDDVLAIRRDSRTMAYAEIFEGFRSELRFPIARLVDTLREELGTSRADIDELKAVVRDWPKRRRGRKPVLRSWLRPNKEVGLRLGVRFVPTARRRRKPRPGVALILGRGVCPVKAPPDPT